MEAFDILYATFRGVPLCVGFMQEYSGKLIKHGAIVVGIVAHSIT
jgi:hypothetical protein